MRGVLNRRGLFRLMAWFLPSLAITDSLAQQSSPWKRAFIVGGFVTGNKFRLLSEAEKTSYLMGIFDGYLFTLSMSGKAKNAQTLRECIPNVQADQLLAIVRRYMDEHPEKWGDSMGLIVFDALPTNCRIDMFQ